MWKRILAVLTLAAVAIFLYRLYLAWRIQQLKEQLERETKEAEAALKRSDANLAITRAIYEEKKDKVEVAIKRAEEQQKLLEDADEWADINRIAGI